MTTRIPVTGSSRYDVVVIGPGDELTAELRRAVDRHVRRVAVVADPRVEAVGSRVVSALQTLGIAAESVKLPSGEPAKSFPAVQDLWQRFGELNLTRSDLVIAIGGGATTDTAGFAAATWLRGIRWIAIPTTLLGMVDAAVGGKTGINTRVGKNLVGAFHPPDAVLVDLALLPSLPRPEWVNGMAEVIKAGFIADPSILDLVEARPTAAADPAGEFARELIERAARVKAVVVSADLREAGQREILNYGHTLGHALERYEGYRIPHGHAVSIGMLFAAALGVHAGSLSPAVAERHRNVLAGVGLPTRYDDPAAWPELLDAMAHDKKARAATVRFVVLEDLAKPRMLENPPAAALEAAWAAVSGAGELAEGARH